MASTGSGVGQYSFTLKQGGDLTISMTWLDDSGNPTNLTGFAMKIEIRAFQSSPVILLTLASTSTTGSRIVLGGTAGTIDLVFAHADTAGLVPNGLPSFSSSLARGIRSFQLGVYDLQYTDPSGDVAYLLEGSVTLDPQITI